MVKKVLIQVVSVFTLVFGTCYQSVLALADNVGQFEIHSSKVMDKDGRAVERVKAGSTQKLVFDMTINNKDGDKASGTTDVFIPETQLKVMKAKVNATSSIPDAKASLYMEKNRKLRLKWSGVEHTARFTLEVPVEIGNPMTLTDLPVAVDDATSYTQQMIVLAEDAKDDAVSEAITENELPTDLTQQLDNYLKQVEAQKAEEEEKAAQKKADAEKKAAEAKKAAAKLAESKKLEAAQEAKEKADAKKEKEQQASDLEKAEEEAKETIENNADKPAAKSSRASTRAEGRQLESLLNDNGDLTSFFQDINYKVGDTEYPVTHESTFDPAILEGKNFTLNYGWTIADLNQKLGDDGPVNKDDTYSFEIRGLNALSQDIVSQPIQGTIDGHDGEVTIGFFSIEKVSDNVQRVTISFTETGIDETSEFWLSVDQKYNPGEPIYFEWNDGAVVSMLPSHITDALDKEGQFISDSQIQWTVEMNTSSFGSLVDGGMKFGDIELADALSVDGGTHKFDEDKINFSAKYKDDDTDLTDNFEVDAKNGQMTIVGKNTEDHAAVKDNSTIVFTFLTEYEVAKDNEGNFESEKAVFTNKIKATVGQLDLEEVKADVSTDVVSKKSGAAVNGTYPWTVDIDLQKFKIDEGSIQKLVINDTLKGPHKFEQKTEFRFTVGDDDYSEYFSPIVSSNGDGVVITVKPIDEIKDVEDYSELITALQTGKLTITYSTKDNGDGGAISSVSNKVEVSLNGQIINNGSGTSQEKGFS
ncbi:adhesive domain-containing protein [Secundilactobacillus paracollinoides]|uniref:Putative adhesive domain-containing protein n=1 Tax=Secundilactobacillus paracollinoides TaxID=240427 RepID=A0A1B2IVA6_9LACO|nr:adhesive domain-containing protein [Secundilactobacillus paracollinoides]ANZ60191.1 hypothetical protein AYR61_01705 [Secundilactobacillus paracollinoides]ANZ65985.1 hypothetical protein AYR63_01725 [Secundilactobacillus paracollinoides]